MTENIARLEPRLLFSSPAHSFELHTDKEIYSFASGATVKSTRQEECLIDKVKFNAEETLLETEIPVTFFTHFMRS